jgi:predicted AAA+ superfamily ATPase
MGKIFTRALDISLPNNRSAFLWGPRKVGKTHWVSRRFPDDIFIDLLKNEVFAEYSSRPWLLRERFEESTKTIVIDEIQMVPDLLNEIHWMIENRGTQFLLTGSSTRKLRRGHANLLGGRAWRFTMEPLCWAEVDDYDLEEVMTRGLLPPHFLSPDPMQDLRAYVADYLKEEIAAEATIQNLPAFAEFLHVAAVTSGTMLNYTNVAREAGVSGKVVRGYFQMLEDTLLGFRLAPWRKRVSRRLVETEKFYLFDVGITNYLSRRRPATGTPEFGNAFEQLMLMELKAYRAYRDPELEITFWRTSSGIEVDFILGPMDVAIEVKAKRRISSRDVSPLRSLAKEQQVGQAIVVSLEDEPRTLSHGIVVLPWRTFLDRLWGGEIVAK